MNRRHGLIGVAFAVLLVTAGCESFKDANGNAASFRLYDSVQIEQVSMDPALPQQEIHSLTEGFLQYDLLVSDVWQRGDDWDPEPFALYLESFATTSGTLANEELKPAMTREEYAKRYAEKKKELSPHLNKAKGTRPLRLRVHISRVEFPAGVKQIVLGNKAEVRATVTAHDPESSTLIGTAEFKSIHGIPGVPLSPYAMATRAALNAVFDQYTRKHVMELAQKLSREIVEELAKAKRKQ